MLLNWQMAVVNVAVVPLVVLNFKVETAEGDFCQSEINSVAPPPFSGDQMDASCAGVAASDAPKTSLAAAFANVTAPAVFTSSAGHVAFSRPKTTSGFID